MKPDDRRREILSLLRRENGLPVQKIADYLGVSHMTVRRDVETLVSDDSVRVIHGGVILSPTVSGEMTNATYSLNAAGEKRLAAKARIGALAAAIVEEGDTIVIDSGSTTECLARRLPDDRAITVLSYALNIVTLTAHRENVRSVFAGGVLHENTLMFESPEGIALIQRHRATKAFVSAAGASFDLGVTCLNAYERETKNAVIESSATKILLADSTKFGAICSEYFAELADFQMIISDTDLDSKACTAIRAMGIGLLLA